MTKVFSKTKEQQKKFTSYWFFAALLVVISVLFYLFTGHAEAQLETENLVQATIMSYRLKVALGLTALGSILAYAITYALAHSSLGRWAFHWDSTVDDSSTKGAKIIALGLVLASSLVGVFTMLSHIIGS